jgi:hypothetical protein
LGSLHDQDLHAWAAEQAALLRAGDLSSVDAAHIAEEIEGMGSSLQDQLTSRLGVLLAHLLKWRYQPARRGNSWRLTIIGQRRRTERLLRKNPSLKRDLAETLADAYGDAILAAARETDLPEDTFPPGCPWTFDQALTEDLP